MLFRSIVPKLSISRLVVHHNPTSERVLYCTEKENLIEDGDPFFYQLVDVLFGGAKTGGCFESMLCVGRELRHLPPAGILLQERTELFGVVVVASEVG